MEQLTNQELLDALSELEAEQKEWFASQQEQPKSSLQVAIWIGHHLEQFKPRQKRAIH